MPAFPGGGLSPNRGGPSSKKANPLPIYLLSTFHLKIERGSTKVHQHAFKLGGCAWILVDHPPVDLRFGGPSRSIRAVRRVVLDARGSTKVHQARLDPVRCTLMNS